MPGHRARPSTEGLATNTPSPSEFPSTLAFAFALVPQEPTS